MSQVSTDKRSHLATLTGLPADTHVSTLERVFLETALGEEGPNLWLKYFKANGATAGQYNTAAREYLIAIGCTPASVSTMWAQAWREGLVGGGGGGAALAFHAATYDETTFEMLPQAIGTGTPTFSVDDGLLLPDADGVYVPIAEDTAPWHGARWDAGTAYADDDGGDPLPEIPSLYSAPAYTNLQTYSNDLTNGVWTASNVTVARNADGLTGAANTACTLTATANNGTVIANALTSASDDHTARWFIQRGSGTGTVEITVDNGTTWQDVTSTVDGSDTWPECLEGLTLANPQVGIRLGTSGDSVIVGNAECIKVSEAEVRGSAPIITAGSTVSVAATQSRFDKVNADTDGPGVVYGEIAVLSDASAGEPIIFSTSNNTNTVRGQLVYQAASERFKARGSTGTIVAVNVVGFTVGDFYSAAVAFSLADTSYYLTNGDNTDEQTDFGGWADVASYILTGDTDDSDYGCVVLTRNLREYTAADYATAKTEADDLVL